jgi:long-subunit acyl-CoA synthetase (AMP-forming)
MSLEEAAASLEVKKEISKQIAEKRLLGYQKLAVFRLVADEWTAENGVLSPTFTPERTVFAKRYTELIDAMSAAE